MHIPTEDRRRGSIQTSVQAVRNIAFIEANMESQSSASYESGHQGKTRRTTAPRPDLRTRRERPTPASQWSTVQWRLCARFPTFGKLLNNVNSGH